MIEYQMQARDPLTGETCEVKTCTKNDLPTVTKFVDHLRSEGWTVFWGGPNCGRTPLCCGPEYSRRVFAEADDVGFEESRASIFRGWILRLRRMSLQKRSTNEQSDESPGDQ